MKKVTPVAGAITAGSVAAAAAPEGVAADVASITNDYKPAEPGVTRDNAKPGQEHNFGLRRRKAATKAARQRILETRREVAALDGAGLDAGTEAGRNIPDAIAGGIRVNSGTVEAAGQTLMSRITALFGAGVDVPVRMNPNDAAPTSLAVPPANPLSSVRGGNVTVHVQTGSGDPNEIARQVSKQVAQSSREALRGASCRRLSGTTRGRSGFGCGRRLPLIWLKMGRLNGPDYRTSKATAPKAASV
ncbi:hypothetical protein ABIE41_002137 [Bosea sp. OAE506]|uniref:hypothetical protein n=1 Tax=Bosea sp. OAE506 TaxID=2663870 RepID=UPI00178B4F5A